NPDMCLLFSARSVVLLLLKLYTGLLPFMPLKETHLEIFVPAHLVKLFGHKMGDKWWHSVLGNIASALLIRPALFDHLAKRGIQTYLWVMNTEEDIKSAFDSGATGVMTDYPTLLRDFLEKNPQYVQHQKFS
ncbi:unnamed protein product, partial [Meganyctiphanes norvegica]